MSAPFFRTGLSIYSGATEKLTSVAQYFLDVV
jgi:hypothetical protein